MPVTVASAALTDDEFLTAFDSCTLPNTSFRHGDHLRFAWLQLHRHSFEEGLNLVHSGIRKFAEYNGMPYLFHDTITTAWVRLLATHHEASFTEFIALNDHRLTASLLHRFWTPAVLESDAARRGWVPPDKAPLPEF
jgi:hypothetical protein